MKVLITTSSFGQIDSAPLIKLKRSGYQVILNPYGRKLNEEEVAGLIQEHQPVAMVAGVEPLTSSVIQKAAPWLRVISRCGTGLESVDLEAAERMGISVTNTPDATTVPVAELTLGLILAVLRGLHISDRSIRENRWERPMGSLLCGKTVGIIGCGRIGRHLAKNLYVLGCRVLGFDLTCPDCNHIEFIELEVLLKDADIVTLHLPSSEANHNFMNEDRIQTMKKGSYLINAARGNLIDEEALYDALESGHLAGAALDTFKQEPYRGPLKDLNNVLLTAHIGSYAREARVMMEKEAVDKLLEFL